ncbi:hypothetical protein F4815DRAFT_440744 [Daldinia loculata]|nr:hypothetical protein F4815DRAFT_440744 [Daldinia loculata]
MASLEFLAEQQRGQQILQAITQLVRSRRHWTLRDEHDSQRGKSKKKVQSHDLSNFAYFQSLPSSAQTILFDSGCYLPSTDDQHATVVPTKRARSNSDSFREELRQRKRVCTEKTCAKTSTTTISSTAEVQRGRSQLVTAGGKKRAYIDQFVKLINSCLSWNDKLLEASDGDEDLADDALSKILTSTQEELDKAGLRKVGALEKQTRRAGKG